MFTKTDFPIFQQQLRGKNLIYLDSAATTQKPQSVLAALVDHYTHANANVQRGVSTLSNLADEAYAGAREKVRTFINAKEVAEIIFVRNTTEAINLVVQSYGRTFLRAGDEIIISIMEHHSNFVPWQLLRDQIGIKITALSVTERGELDLDEYARLLERQPKLVALTHVSNVLGTINPVKQITHMAHTAGAHVLLDGAQAIAHLPVDVQDLDCDFYVFSGHKMYAPTGIGVLYGKQNLLEKMPPYQGGGGMIQAVTLEKTIYAISPEKFEAGTPSIADAVALGAAIDYLQKLTMPKLVAHEQMLLAHATKVISEISGVRILGTAAHKIGVLSLIMDGVHPHDVGTILDRDGIAVRAGHHCAMPLMQRFNIPATTRISFGVYNTIDDINALVQSLIQVKRIFKNG